MATGSHFPNVQLNQLYADASFRHSLKQHGDIEGECGGDLLPSDGSILTLFSSFLQTTLDSA